MLLKVDSEVAKNRKSDYTRPNLRITMKSYSWRSGEGKRRAAERVLENTGATVPLEIIQFAFTY